MALPPGLTPKTVTIGIASFTDGSLAEGTATITAPVNLVHTPTNRPIFSSQMSKRFVDGEVSFDLLPTDAPGLNRIDWTFKLNVTITGALIQPEPIWFVLPTAGPDEIDLDALVTVPSSAGTPISVDVLTSDELPALMTAVAADTDSEFSVAQRAAFGSAAKLVDGRQYRMVAGVIRNAGGPDYWQPVADDNHRSQNIDTVTTGATVISINYAAINARRMVSFVATPDETLAQAGFLLGASVSRDHAEIRFGRARTISDYVSYNGTAFTSPSGAFTPAWANGRLTLTHEDLIGVAGNAFIATLTPRGPNCRPYLSSAVPATSTTTVAIEFADAAGAQIMTPTTDMKLYVSRGVTQPTPTAQIDPRLVTEAKFPTSNLWFMGIFEVE